MTDDREDYMRRQDAEHDLIRMRQPRSATAPQSQPGPAAEVIASVRREIAERTRNAMGILADLRESVDLDDDSSEAVLGYCDDLETAIHNIAAVASHLHQSKS